MRVGEQVPITPDDDNWHDHTMHYWETETNWWSFNVPERSMGGWLYTQEQVNRGVCNGGAWVWDDSDAGAIYEVRHEDLPFVRGDLRHESFPNGVTLEVLEPLNRYRTTYSDPDGGFECELVHEGLIPPHSHPLETWPFWGSRHFDQPMRVTGTLNLHGEEIAVDCFSVRDRSWGPRPRGPVPPEYRLPEGAEPDWPRSNRPKRPFAVGYVFGTQDENEIFLAFTDPVIDDRGVASDDLTAGYLVRGGVYAPLIAGFRTIELDPVTKFIRRIHLVACDSLGRDLVADGELIAHHGTNPVGTGLFRWEWTGGCVGYGEDQSGGAPDVFEALDMAAARG